MANGFRVFQKYESQPRREVSVEFLTSGELIVQLRRFSPVFCSSSSSSSTFSARKTSSLLLV